MTVNPLAAAADEAKSNALQSKPTIRMDWNPFDLALLARLSHCEWPTSANQDDKQILYSG
jgi:hypothetical protein